MQISKEELIHIANLAQLNIEENEIESYLKNLTNILNFANIVNNAPIQDCDITVATNEAKNIFRKDEVKDFTDIEALMKNAPNQEFNMFRVPKVVN